MCNAWRPTSHLLARRTVAAEFTGDHRIDLTRGRDIVISGDLIVLHAIRNPTAVERTGLFRVDTQNRAIVENRFRRLAEL